MKKCATRSMSVDQHLIPLPGKLQIQGQHPIGEQTAKRVTDHPGEVAVDADHVVEGHSSDGRQITPSNRPDLDRSGFHDSDSITAAGR
jgi:hypothetical protein